MSHFEIIVSFWSPILKASLPSQLSSSLLVMFAVKRQDFLTKFSVF